jgi:hypothetical protein
MIPKNLEISGIVGSRPVGVTSAGQRLRITSGALSVTSARRLVHALSGCRTKMRPRKDVCEGDVTQCLYRLQCSSGPRRRQLSQDSDREIPIDLCDPWQALFEKRFALLVPLAGEKRRKTSRCELVRDLNRDIFRGSTDSAEEKAQRIGSPNRTVFRGNDLQQPCGLGRHSGDVPCHRERLDRPRRYTDHAIWLVQLIRRRERLVDRSRLRTPIRSMYRSET